MKQEEEDGEMGVFYNLSNAMELVISATIYYYEYTLVAKSSLLIL